MTVEDVKARVEEIKVIGNGDPEVAHSKEDVLYKQVLWEISKINKGLAGDLAYEALKADELDFPRWCA
jgi:hypothetical protein